MELSPGEPVEKKPILNAAGTIISVLNQSAATEQTGTLTVDQLDIEILPVIYDIVRWYRVQIFSIFVYISIRI